MKYLLVLATLAGAAAFAAPPPCPFSALRMGPFTERSENWAKLLPALETNRAAFDEIWFSTGVCFPKMDWHEECARRCAKCAEDLRRIGITPSIEIQTILGHTDEIALKGGDNSGVEWRRRMDWDGTAAKVCPCPTDPRLLDYFRRVAALHAQWKPGIVFVDDDLCIKPRTVTKADPFFVGVRRNGCFCDACIAAFSKTSGRTWTRETLTAAMRAEKDLDGTRHGFPDPDQGERGVNRAWRDFHVGVIAGIARSIAEEVHRVSPDTVMGYQFGRGHVEVAQALAEGSGHPIRTRPGAGAYYDSNPRDQMHKAYQLAWSAKRMGGDAFISARCPEIETCPRTFFCRTPQAVILEAFENLSMGMDFLSMFIATWRSNESMDYYGGKLFPRIAEARPFLERFRDLNRGAKPCGFTVPGIEPPSLVSQRGLPILTGNGISLGPLPAITELAVNGSGSSWGADQASRVAQIMSGPDWKKWIVKADEASGRRLPIVFADPVFAFVMPNVTEKGVLRSVAVVNASIDRQEPVRVLLRGVPQGAKVRWNVIGTEPDELFATAVGTDEVSVTLPRVGAWQCGYLEIRDAATGDGWGRQIVKAVVSGVLAKETSCTAAGTLGRIDPGLKEVGRLAAHPGPGGDGISSSGSARCSAWLDEESNPVGLTKTTLAGREVCVAAFLRNGKKWRFVWFSHAEPSAGCVFTPVDLSGTLGRMSAPALVEMVSGRIFEIADTKAVPLWDSPLLVAEKHQLPFATDWSVMKGGEIVDAWYKRFQRSAMKAFPVSMKGEPWLDWPAERFLPCIDRYGQFRWREWPGKVHGDAELKAARDEEEKDLAAHPGPEDRDVYGGWAKGPRLEATGRFRTHRDTDGRWWLVGPDGCLFWSWGPVRVTPSSAMTPMNGDKDSIRIGCHLPDRDCFFEDLPPAQGNALSRFWTTYDELLKPFYDVRGETRVYDLSSANLYRKYGEDYYARFADQAHRRIRSWGMNTIANSSDVRICLMDRTPYAERVEVKGGVLISGSWGMWGKFRDPFAETFEADVIRALAEHGKEAHDRWCIGFFVDNEIEWGGKPEDLAVWTLWSRDDQPAKIEFLKRLAAKGIVYDGDYTRVPKAELTAFTEALCEEYFRRTRRAVKTFDPKLLYLGCRYCGAPSWSVKPCAKYCDVVSWNIYRASVADWRIPGGFDAPVLIGEFHFGATDRGPFGTGVCQAKDQVDRAAKMKAYVASALANPQVVGVHWHQFSDQAVTGRFDGEGLQVGFTDVCDRPYPEMREALREIGHGLYAGRFYGKGR